MKDWKDTFEIIKAEDFNENVFKLIGHDWLLLTAGTTESFNVMTASWGTMGILWNKPVVQIFVRPTRYTFQFIENQDVFTVSILEKGNKDKLNLCGTKSGREIDKIKESGLLPIMTKENGICYEQSRIVLECKKIYFDDLKPVFILPDEVDDKFYPEKDYHRQYFGEILSIYRKK
jgi:flavin reductase (DIM6/NTAB) family NADH-FMN oxidoreductase RutF